VIKVNEGERCATEEKRSTSLARARRAYRRTQNHWFAIALAIIAVVTIALIIPIFQETEIHVQIGYADNVTNVWVNSPSKPLISHLFPPSYSLGAYTLNVTITIAIQIVANFTRINVPIGEYVIVWQSGVPPHGYYTIMVQLYRLNTLKDTYTFSVSF
jgi:hypothetical protein